MGNEGDVATNSTNLLFQQIDNRTLDQMTEGALAGANIFKAAFDEDLKFKKMLSEEGVNPEKANAIKKVILAYIKTIDLSHLKEPDRVQRILGSIFRETPMSWKEPLSIIENPKTDKEKALNVAYQKMNSKIIPSYIEGEQEIISKYHITQKD